MPTPALESARTECDRIAAGQGWAISRGQALAAGMSDAKIGRELSGRRWQRSAHEGVYFVRTGPVAYLSRCWAALLHAGPGAALGLETAGWLHGLLDRAPPLVHVVVPGDRRLAGQDGVRVHIRSGLPPRVHPARTPARVTVEDTVLDLVDRPQTRPGDVIDLVLRACQRRLTTADRLRTASRDRKKMRHRRLLVDLLAEAATGVHSVLEHRYVRDVERAHDLPRSRRNRPEPRPGGRVYRDARYDRYGTVVELDGDASHPLDRRELDDLRDNQLLVEEGTRTLRYGWRSVAVRPCATAGQVATLLRRGGWPGVPRRCGPDCRLPPIP